MEEKCPECGAPMQRIQKGSRLIEGDHRRSDQVELITELFCTNPVCPGKDSPGVQRR